jgi:predicted ATPase/DNA-binding CsgD family transcriptional regulator
MSGHNLPGQPTPFIGREPERAEIANLLANPDCRLLTLVGPGGIGKTRLAIEAARFLIDSPLPEGEGPGVRVHFVPLQPLTSPDFIVPTVAGALHFAFYGEQDPKSQLLSYLRDKHLLLVLDNFEHVMDGAGLLPEMLEAAPGVKLLVTSRERLSLREEWVVDVHGLPYPEQDAGDPRQEYGAVQLFVQHSRRTGYRPVDDDAAAITRICRLVEGIPLAIELAAAWVRAMPCAAIAREIERSLDILTTTTRNVPEKHRSMRAAFEHSWKLLTEEEQAVFRKLSVFRGGFTREAAAKVAAASLATLAALVDKSMLRVDANGRYSLQELMRQYADYQLERSGEAEAARDAHCAYYADYLHQLAADLKSANQIRALGEMEQELDNVRVSWGWAVEQSRDREILQSLDSLGLFYQIRSRFHEGVEAFDMAVERFADTETEVLGQTLMLQGWFSFFECNSRKGKELLLKGEAIMRRLGFHKMMPLLFSHLYSHADELGGFEVVRKLYEDSLAIFRQTGDMWRIAWVLHGLGWYAYVFDQYEEAQQLQQESLSIFRAIGDHWGSIWALNTLGDWATQRGDYDEARQFFEEGLAINREIGDPGGIRFSLGKLGSIADLLRESRNFRKYLADALRARLASGLLPKWFNDSELYLIACWFEAEGQAEQAVEMLACCQCNLDLSSEFSTYTKAARRLDALKAELPPHVFAAAWQRGATRDFEGIAVLLPEILLTLEEQTHTPVSGAVNQPLIEPLSARELEILHLIANGLNSREIAQRLTLSVGTVRWYLKQIYSKLDAHSRAQALARARELNLLV